MKGLIFVCSKESSFVYSSRLLCWVYVLANDRQTLALSLYTQNCFKALIIIIIYWAIWIINYVLNAVFFFNKISKLHLMRVFLVGLKSKIASYLRFFLVDLYDRQRRSQDFFLVFFYKRFFLLYHIIIFNSYGFSLFGCSAPISPLLTTAVTTDKPLWTIYIIHVFV